MMNDVSSNNVTGDNARLLASYLLPLSLFAIAGAIVYFTYELAIVSKQIPDILERIDATTEKVEPILDEIAVITDLVPAILSEVEETRKMIPPILEEVEQARKTIPPILKEVEQMRGQLPAVLKESEAIRGELPTLLASADKASDAVTGVAGQVPAILKEVETTRESIPALMDRADGLIEKARVAGKEASQGAVTGIFSGIIMAPFSLIADVGQGISGMSEEEAKDFNEKDFELIEQAALQLLNTGDIGNKSSWNNAESDNHGDMTLTETYDAGEYFEIECRTLAFKMYKKDDLIKETNRSFCKTDDGTWDFDTD